MSTDEVPPLKTLIVQYAPRDLSGSRAVDRFDYQKDWTFCRLLELYQGPGDYLVLCDYHDDVVILNSEMEPTTVSFYQIKTHEDGGLNATELIERGKGKDVDGALGKVPGVQGETESTGLSIIGKLYYHTNRVEVQNPQLVIVSNLYFRTQSDSSVVNKDNFCFSALGVKERSRIATAIQREFALECLPTLENIWFEFSGLSLKMHEVGAIGVLEKFINKKMPGGGPSAQRSYERLISEVQRKIRYDRVCDTFESLKANKGISRRDFHGMVRDALTRPSVDQMWQTVVGELLLERVPLKQRLKLGDAWLKYAFDRLDTDNLLVQDLRARAVEIAQRWHAAEAEEGFSSFATNGLCEIRAIERFSRTPAVDGAAMVSTTATMVPYAIDGVTPPALPSPLVSLRSFMPDDVYIKAVLLFELMECRNSDGKQEQTELPKANQESTTEAP